MEKIELTPRLETISRLVSPGARLVDVGCDHAKLTIHLLTQGVIASAVASDLREGPLSHAKRNAEAHGVASRMTFRLAAGLHGVSPEACDTIVIAGMGGETIAEILQEASWTRLGMHSLLLQPMTMIPNLRQFLWAMGYVIFAEHICKEDKRFYVVLEVRGGGAVQHKERAECMLSGALLQDAHAGDYFRFLLQTERKALCGMLQSKLPNEAEIQEKQQAIALIEEALEGLA